MAHVTLEKRCGKCKLVKLADQFYRCRSTKDGLQGRCSVCDKAAQRDKHVRNSRRVVEIHSQKRCGKCKLVKPADQFNRCRSKKDGLQGRCRACDSVVQHDQAIQNRREWAKLEAQQKNAAEVKKRPKCKSLMLPAKKRCSRCELVKAANQFHRCRSFADGLQCWCKDCQSEARMKAQYGITKQQLHRLAEGQGGVCAVCRRASDVAGTFHVDHDHETGAVRGLLCSSCNHAIGMAGDSPDVLVRAAIYLSDSPTVLLLVQGVGT